MPMTRPKMLAKMQPITSLVTEDVRPIVIPAPEKLLSPPIIATDDVAVCYDGRVVRNRAELALKILRQFDAEFAFEQVSDAALAGLRVHADDLAVFAADVRRINREIRHVPMQAAAPRQHRKDEAAIGDENPRQNLPGLARPRRGDAQHVPPQEELQQQRYVAQRLDVDRSEVADEPVGGEPRNADDEA